MRSRGRLDANLELALLGVEELDDAGGDLDLMGGQKPALRAPAQAADAAAMRPPDTVIPDGLNPFEIQEAYRALKGHVLRIETYADAAIRGDRTAAGIRHQRRDHLGRAVASG